MYHDRRCQAGGEAQCRPAPRTHFAIAIAFPTSVAAHGDWPEGPHRHWFEGFQRPDNHLHPYRQFDQKSLFCCGAADVVKTRFKVENAGDRHPEDVWYAWLDSECTGHEQAAQIAVTLFADAAEPVLAPLECCFGTSPIQAEKLRPDRKVRGSATLATRAVASIGPTPGM